MDEMHFYSPPARSRYLQNASAEMLQWNIAVIFCICLNTNV